MPAKGRKQAWSLHEGMGPMHQCIVEPDGHDFALALWLYRSKGASLPQCKILRPDVAHLLRVKRTRERQLTPVQNFAPDGTLRWQFRQVCEPLAAGAAALR